jgi:hypothetical protein
MDLTAETSSPEWQDFTAGTNVVVATTATIAAAAVFALQHRMGITADLADTIRLGQVLLVLLAAVAAYMLWSPSLGSAGPGGGAGSTGTGIHGDRLHVLASGGRISAPGESTLEWVPFGSGHAWVRTNGRR